MSWQDAVNAAYEFSGSVAVWLNVRALYKDRGYAGGRVYVSLFFFTWSWWNLYYYPHLGQMSTTKMTFISQRKNTDSGRSRTTERRLL